MNPSSYCHVSQTVEAEITLQEHSGAHHSLSFYLLLLSYKIKALSSSSLVSELDCSLFLSAASLDKELAPCTNCEPVCYRANL